jgi:hypothetical protein
MFWFAPFAGSICLSTGAADGAVKSRGFGLITLRRKTRQAVTGGQKD